MVITTMMKTTARVGASGAARIPYDVRVKLGIMEGDQLILEIKDIIHVHADGNKGLKDKSEQSIH